MANGPLLQEQPVALRKAILYRPAGEGKKSGLLVFPQPSPRNDKRISAREGRPRLGAPLFNSRRNDGDLQADSKHVRGE
jgi:hypothetical protein